MIVTEIVVLFWQAPRIKTTTFQCLKCFRRFLNRQHFASHLLRHRDENKRKLCQYCTMSFRSSKLLEVHMNTYHRCEYCDFSANIFDLIEHNEAHKRGVIKSMKFDQRGRGLRLNAFPFSEIEAFQGFMKTYRFRNTHEDNNIISVRDFFNRFKFKINQILFHNVSIYNSIKFQITLLCKFKRMHPSVDEEEVEFMETTEQYFNSSLKIILSPLYINRIFCDMVNEIDNNVEIFERNGSGWILDEVKGCDIRTAQFEILKGGCSCIIPSHLKNKNAIVNPDNKENDCFASAFLICMHGDSVDNRHRGRISQYEKFKTHYDFSTIKVSNIVERYHSIRKAAQTY